LSWTVSKAGPTPGTLPCSAASAPGWPTTQAMRCKHTRHDCFHSFTCWLPLFLCRRPPPPVHRHSLPSRPSLPRPCLFRSCSVLLLFCIFFFFSFFFFFFS